MRKLLKRNYSRFARLSLILVYLVILAGAVVRMTGSGMGCPDWPKCFGYLIPPTEESALLWSADKAYERGQVIIREEQLLLAKKDFRTGDAFNAGNWEPYTRHDYATFNATHTWVEYINRLLGALSGLAILGMGICSLAWWREKKSRVLFAWLTVIAIGFQAWLGATVVYSVLAPFRITLHMFMALAIVGMLLWIIFRDTEPEAKHKSDPYTFRLWIITAFLSLVQILLGTQVRQFIDERAKLLGESTKDLWLQDPDVIFYVHRSFSILILLLHIWVAYRIYSMRLGYRKINPILGTVFVIILSGVAMNYLHFPWGSQAIHLFLAAILFGLQWYLILEMWRPSRTHISS